MLETIREFGLEQLAGSEGKEMPRRHAEFFLTLAEAAEVPLNGPQQGSWLARLEVEHDNFRAALRWAVNGEDPELGLKFGRRLVKFWMVRGYIAEGRGWLGQGLTASGVSPRVRGPALDGAGELALWQGDYKEATALLEEGLSVMRHGNDWPGLVHVLRNRGQVAAALGEDPVARVHFEEALKVARKHGVREQVVDSLAFLGEVEIRDGDRTKAAALFDEALALSRDMGDMIDAGYVLARLGDLALDESNYALAVNRYREALSLWWEHGAKAGFLECFWGIGAAAVGIGNGERAARLFGAEAALNDTFGAPWGTAGQAWHDLPIIAAREQLGEASFAAGYALGRALPLDDAVAEALALADELAVRASPENGAF
jgi:tetratricopeptide (TPR) repeat protein